MLDLEHHILLNCRAATLDHAICMNDRCLTEFLYVTSSFLYVTSSFLNVTSDFPIVWLNFWYDVRVSIMTCHDVSWRHSSSSSSSSVLILISEWYRFMYNSPRLWMIQIHVQFFPIGDWVRVYNDCESYMLMYNSSQLRIELGMTMPESHTC